MPDQSILACVSDDIGSQIESTGSAHDTHLTLPSAADVLKARLRYVWMNARWVLEDLDEDEYFWEPTPLCWSVRRRAPEMRGWGRCRSA